MLRALPSWIPGIRNGIEQVLNHYEQALKKKQAPLRDGAWPTVS
jgi:hypothetical protein